MNRTRLLLIIAVIIVPTLHFYLDHSCFRENMPTTRAKTSAAEHNGKQVIFKK